MKNMVPENKSKHQQNVTFQKSMICCCYENFQNISKKTFLMGSF